LKPELIYQNKNCKINQQNGKIRYMIKTNLSRLL